MGTIAISILKNNDAVILARLLVGVIVCFSHPQPSAIIDTETNRLLDVRLTGKESHVEPLGHLHRLRGLQWRERFLDNRLRVLLGTPKIERNQ